VRDGTDAEASLPANRHTHVPSATARTRIPGRAHLWMLFVRPPVGQLATPAPPRTQRRAGAMTIRLYTPHGPPAPAPSTSEGWTAAGPAFPEPLLGLDLVEYRRVL
jgi:hypothetical protein